MRRLALACVVATTSSCGLYFGHSSRHHEPDAGDDDAMPLDGAPEVSGIPDAVDAAPDAAVTPLEALSRFEVERPGSNCANGGTAVRDGLDADQDGRLDASRSPARGSSASRRRRSSSSCS